MSFERDPPSLYSVRRFVYFILFYFILFYFILFYFILFYFILFYFILFYSILFSESGWEDRGGSRCPLRRPYEAEGAA